MNEKHDDTIGVIADVTSFEFDGGIGEPFFMIVLFNSAGAFAVGTDIVRATGFELCHGLEDFGFDLLIPLVFDRSDDRAFKDSEDQDIAVVVPSNCGLDSGKPASSYQSIDVIFDLFRCHRTTGARLDMFSNFSIRDCGISLNLDIIDWFIESEW